MNRRNFIKLLAGTGAAAILSSGTPLRPTEWDFLEEHEKLDLDEEQMEKTILNAAKISNETPVGNMNTIAKQFAHYVEQKLQEYNLSGNLIADMKKTFYAFPTKSKKFEEYVLKAISFTEQKLEIDLPKKIQKVELFTDYSEEQNTIFLCKTYIEKYAAYVNNIKIDGYAQPEGSTISTTPKGYKIILTTGRTALVSPISETIHQTTTETCKKHNNNVSVNEGVVESIAYTIAREFVKEIGIPDGQKTLDELTLKLMEKPGYKLLKSGLKAVNKMGIKELYEFYKERPDGVEKLLNFYETS